MKVFFAMLFIMIGMILSFPFRIIGLIAKQIVRSILIGWHADNAWSKTIQAWLNRRKQGSEGSAPE